MASSEATLCAGTRMPDNLSWCRRRMSAAGPCHDKARPGQKGLLLHRQWAEGFLRNGLAVVRTSLIKSLVFSHFAMQPATCAQSL